jgi:hypothetical protein
MLKNYVFVSTIPCHQNGVKLLQALATWQSIDAICKHPWGHALPSTVAGKLCELLEAPLHVIALYRPLLTAMFRSIIRQSSKVHKWTEAWNRRMFLANSNSSVLHNWGLRSSYWNCRQHVKHYLSSLFQMEHHLPNGNCTGILYIWLIQWPTHWGPDYTIEIVYNCSSLIVYWILVYMRAWLYVGIR